MFISSEAGQNWKPIIQKTEWLKEEQKSLDKMSFRTVVLVIIMIVSKIIRNDKKKESNNNLIYK